MNFYRVVFDDTIRYYKNMTKLCNREGLTYAIVYYHLKTHNIFERNGIVVEKCRFEN